MAEVLQNFAENSTLVSNALAAPIANFQNLLLNAAPGAAPPAGNLLTLNGTPGANLTLTTGVDTPTTGFSGGHGATATNAGAVFLAAPGNSINGLSNTLNVADNLVATGAALGNSTLNYTAVAPGVGGNPAAAIGVTMTGVNAAVITNLAGAAAGFSGTITGLTTATVTATSNNEVDLGLAGPGLNTALTTVNLNAAVGFFANMTAAAFTTPPSATINVSGAAGPAANVVSLTNSGATAGYASLTINSNGTTANVVQLDIGATATNLATITAAGAAALTLTGGAGDNALNIDHLHTFTGNSATTPPGPDTGGLTVTFTSTTASRQRHRRPSRATRVNTFTFDEVTVGATAGAASFTAASTVNGGSGATNTLDIQAATGAILLAGVGAGITGIATIEHTGAQTGALTADLSQMGSATTFDLGGNYTGAGFVTVSNITNAQTVEYSGTSVGTNVLLVHATPVVATDVINFEMNAGPAPGPAELTLTNLVVGADLPAAGLPAQTIASLNIDSTGGAGDNAITDASFIGASINVTGATHLTLGSPGLPYDFAAGTINAVADTGGVSAFLAPIAGNPTAQTFEMGTGTNVANLFPIAGIAGGGVIDFSHGGTDTVVFHGTNPTTIHPINDTAGHFYNNVLGFGSTAAVNSVNVSVGGIPTSYTDGVASPVVAGAATTAFNFTTGTSVTAATTHANFIDITTPITTAAGESVAGAFDAAIGTVVGNGITVAPGVASVLLSFYDNTTSQAVLATAAPAGGVIDIFSTVHVVGLIHESAAAYANLATNTHFVA